MMEEFNYDEVLSKLLSAEYPETENFTNLKINDFFSCILDKLKTEISAPLELFGILAGVILLSALAENLQHQKGGISQVFSVISVVCAGAAAVQPVTEIFLQSVEVLNTSANFMVTFSGVYGGILAVTGNLAASAGYQGAVLLLCNIALQVAVKVLFPLLKMGMGMSLADAVNPAVSLSGILQLVQKVTVWILGLIMTLFLGFLSVQSVVAVSADKISTKAAKYAISGFVPFIGGAVSDAYAAVLGSMNVLKSTTGMTGVIALFMLLVPVIGKLLLYKIIISGAAALSEIFQLDRLKRLFQHLEMLLSVGFSVSVSFGIMFTMSTGLLSAFTSL